LDLKDERAAVVSALLQMDALPAGMELFPAADDDAWTLVERVIESSDYYLLVIGGKYGSVDPDLEISYTEREYDLAIGLKKPTMAFLHGDPDSIELGKSEKDEETRQKLEAFRAKVQKQKHVKFWTSPEDLAGKVALSYANFRQTYPAVGWVRGDVQTSTEALKELNELRKHLDAAEEKLSARTGPPLGTDHLSQRDDSVEFTVSWETMVRTRYATHGTKLDASLNVTLTWDEILSAIGPTLLDESHQGSIERRLNLWLTEHYGGQVRRNARAYIEAEEEVVIGFRGTSVELSEDDFGTILVQLRALGLITRSERKRSVKDRGTYWTLTAYGDEHLTTLRAISRDAREGPDDADASEEDDDE
jgi:hypothetical protein